MEDEELAGTVISQLTLIASSEQLLLPLEIVIEVKEATPTNKLHSQHCINSMAFGE